MATTDTEIERMQSYKGGSFPRPFIPLIGGFLGFLLPYYVREMVLPAEWSDLPPTEAVLMCCQSLSGVALLFYSEFLLGAYARSTSTKASFSPAAAAAAGVAPFCVVRANRIHQNHIENIMILAPAALACAAAGCDPRIPISCLISWVIARIIYRVGYCSEDPFFRLVGQTTSIMLFMQCMYHFVLAKMK